MAEAFLQLSVADRRAVLEIVASRMGRPVHLIEKDVWVVWALNALFRSPFGEHLVFKGGTSLSKVYRVIRRFSEDVDITYDMRQLAGDIVPDEPAPLPKSKTQARNWSEEIRSRVPRWVAGPVMKAIGDALQAENLSATVLVDSKDADTLLIDYERAARESGYTSHIVKLEFGARSTGEPCSVYAVECDAASVFDQVLFPIASPRVMHAERTFWEKATAIHVVASGGKLRGDGRFARHWYDLVQLDAAGYAHKANRDRSLAMDVARHKNAFFAEKDGRGQNINYEDAVQGGLRLVPPGDRMDWLRADYAKMVADGLLMDEALPFEKIIEECWKIEQRANDAARAR